MEDFGWDTCVKLNNVAWILINVHEGGRPLGIGQMMTLENLLVLLSHGSGDLSASNGAQNKFISCIAKGRGR